MKSAITILSTVAVLTGIAIFLNCLSYWHASLSVSTGSAIIALGGCVLFSAGLISLSLAYVYNKK